MPKPKTSTSRSQRAAQGADDLEAATHVVPRIRVLCGTEVALGPGKVALLCQIAATGSLTEAARGLGMSYMRAWKLLQTMNGCFVEPLVTTQRGGAQHGGAVLTRTGIAVLQSYQSMERASLLAMAAAWEELRLHLRAPRRRRNTRREAAAPPLDPTQLR